MFSWNSCFWLWLWWAPWGAGSRNTTYRRVWKFRRRSLWGRWDRRSILFGKWYRLCRSSPARSAISGWVMPLVTVLIWWIFLWTNWAIHSLLLRIHMVLELSLSLSLFFFVFAFHKVNNWVLKVYIIALSLSGLFMKRIRKKNLFLFYFILEMRFRKNKLYLFVF